MKILFILLLPVFVHAQVWPDSTCADVPYTKANDDHIYHTTKCKLDSLKYKMDSSNADTMYCSLCNKEKSREHVMARITTGFIMMAVNSNGIHELSPYGKWIMEMNGPDCSPYCKLFYDYEIIPEQFKKYLPEDYFSNRLKYYILLDTTE